MTCTTTYLSDVTTLMLVFAAGYWLAMFMVFIDHLLRQEREKAATKDDLNADV